MDHVAGGALLRVSHWQQAAVEWVPAIVNFNFLPDMGRMNSRWLSGWLFAGSDDGGERAAAI
jgi:hypothetical protein